MVNIVANRFLALVGIAIVFACLGNSAVAASIETLVMPGKLIEGHVEFEEDCSQCHAAFSKTLQRDLCITCHDHQEISEDIEAHKGFHGLFAPARKAECSFCHTEHEGRDADIIGLDSETFDHQYSDFTLEGSHQAVACDACHESDQKYRAAESECVGCHEDDDNHGGQLEEDCASCHQETSWRETEFDHDKDTEFAITGAHLENECGLCHINQRYKDMPTDCYSCHRVDDNHNGDNGKDCGNCHKTRSWDDSGFDHARESEFALEGKHKEISCDSCHAGNKYDDPLKKECIACHRSDDEHQGLNGEECNNCHKPTDWAKGFFDHGRDTEFPLLGKHEEQSCQACHKARIYDVPLEVECFGCHESDDVHEGDQSTDCAQCHQESGWNNDVVFDHGFTAFPLIGLHVVAPCEACHLSAGFNDAGSRCTDCHADEDPHKGGLGTKCHSCHNPNDWQLWDFDHDTETDFLLDGAHADLNCRSCHLGKGDSRVKASMQCAACHRRDDTHSGQFGSDCARCHSTKSFIDSGRP